MSTSAAVPLVDLKAQYRTIKPEIDEAVLRVLGSAQFILGEEVSAFESEFARYCGVRHAVGVSSGTSALHLALLAAGVGPEHEVITVPHTFVATVAAIRYTGARPVFVDVDRTSYTLDVQQLERAITPRTRVLLPVHLYGQPADMTPILELARRRNLVVIEDAAQAHGADYHGRSVGGFGDLACFSFYPGKNLGAYGEAGAVTTNDDAHAARLRLLRDWGQSRKYHHEILGYNYRMEGIQGAVLRVKLRYLPAWTETRRAHAAWYDRELQGLGVETPARLPGRGHVYHVYSLRTPRRDALMRALQDAEVQVGLHYPVPVHLQPAHQDLGYGRGAFPEAEAAAAELLSVPIYPELEPAQLERVAGAVRRWARA